MTVGNRIKTFLELLGVFLKLGCTSFGGPVAHLGYFRREFVERKAWLSENKFADTIALCQFLPGPASSQVGFCVGIHRGGIPGGLAAWLGFTLPSAVIMIAFAYGVTLYSNIVTGDILRGFKILALAVVTQAVLAMGRALCPDLKRVLCAAVAAAVMLIFPSAWTQVAVIVLGGAVGWLLFHGKQVEAIPGNPSTRSSAIRGTVCLVLFFLPLVLLPTWANIVENRTLQVVDSFYRVGSLVFGGGHVVLPLIQAEVVPRGWITEDAFTAGYGAAQAVPGPLFTFSSYLGASMNAPPAGWAGGIIALVSIFIPSFLLVLGVYPFWESLRAKASIQAALKGTNAAVVGILLAALYHPVWTQAVGGIRDFIIAAAAFCLLRFGKVSVLFVLPACAAATVIF